MVTEPNTRFPTEPILRGADPNLHVTEAVMRRKDEQGVTTVWTDLCAELRTRVRASRSGQ